MLSFFFFFFNDTATTEIYTLSLHDALPIWFEKQPDARLSRILAEVDHTPPIAKRRISRKYEYDGTRSGCCFTYCKDRKSTRLNSSHANISYAVFCLKKKKNNNTKNYLLNTN